MIGNDSNSNNNNDKFAGRHAGGAERPRISTRMIIPTAQLVRLHISLKQRAQ